MGGVLADRIFKYFKDDSEPANSSTEAYLDSLETINPTIGVCGYCGKEYHRGDLGTGIKYCSARCKYTEGGTKTLHKTCGRPRRFPRVHSLAVVNLIADDLRARGFSVTSGLYPDKNRMLAYYGESNEAFKIGVGGDQKRERWAHALLFLRGDVHTRLVVKNPCGKTRSKEHQSRMDGVGTTRRLIHIPCYKDTCTTCSNFKHFHAVLNSRSQKGVTYRLA